MSHVNRRVLGVDPGLTRCGVGIVEGAIGKPLSLIGVGVILTPTDAPLEQRLLQLESELEEWIALHLSLIHI
jgi:crossover junction endodeoxyribonuclease RuvC